MDKEVRDRYYRIVGGLQVLQDVAKHATCMPCDAATEALLVVARHAIDQAVLSAWNYANENTRAADSAGSTQEQKP
jgi:hypothetical protein